MILLIITIMIAFLFDFSNGQHDASGAVAPVISTGTMHPKKAILLCAFFNFIAFMVYGLHVAGTIGKGIVATDIITLPIILSTLLAAIIWNTLTLKFGIPSSSSHALIGSLVGAVFSVAGIHGIIFKGLIPIILAIVISPLLGMIFAIILGLSLNWLLVGTKLSWINKYSRWLQIASCSFMSMAHGGNDAQKTMGIIFLALVSSHHLTAHDNIPLWVVVGCQLAMATGTLCGGKAILHTMGSGITKLQPWQGFTSQTATSLVLSLATSLGIPVSSTHTITGALAGVGMSRSIGYVRWRMLKKVFMSWIITLPCSACFAYIFTKIVLMVF